jgi:hypothetical protein
MQHSTIVARLQALPEGRLRLNTGKDEPPHRPVLKTNTTHQYLVEPERRGFEPLDADLEPACGTGVEQTAEGRPVRGPERTGCTPSPEENILSSFSTAREIFSDPIWHRF